MGRPRASPAARRPPEDGGRHSDRGVHPPAPLPVPQDGRVRVAPRAVAAKLGSKVTTNFRVASLRPCEGGWAVKSTSGEERRYRQIVATIPIGTLFGALGEVPSAVQSAADGLRYNSLRVILIGVRGTDLPPYTALYVPDPQSLYHRVCYNRVFSSDMVPDGTARCLARSTVSPRSDLDAWADERLLDRVVDDLVRDAILRRDAVCYRAAHREKYAYVVYTTGYGDRVRTIREYTQSRGIHLAGRFAEFQYVNTDACVRRALDLARQLRGGDIAPEARLTAPSIAR